MNTVFVPFQVYTDNLMINQTDSPSHSGIVVVTVEISKDQPTLTELKQALRVVESYKNDEIIIQRPYSEFDCTGAPFTSGINRINREVVRGFDKAGIFEVYKLIYIYIHDIAIDV
jgi:hypothetical protein